MTTLQSGGETAPLIQEADDPPQRVQRILPKRLIVVEPLLILYWFAGFPLETVYHQYFLRKVGYEMGIDYDHLNFTTNVTCGTSVNDTAYLQREAVQAQAAHWNLYISLVTFVPSIISKVIYGYLSDRIGRRLCFILPPIGSIWSVSLYLLAIHFNWPVEIFFLSAIEYCFGSMDLLMIGTFAYIADTTGKKWLAVRITIIEVLVQMSGGMAEFGVGYLVQYSGYFWSLVLVFCLKVLTLLYAIFFIPETVPKETPSSGSPEITRSIKWKDYLRSIRLYTHDDGTGRQWKILLLTSCFCISALYNTNGIAKLYQQNAPLCWKSVMIGYYDGLSLICLAGGALGGLVLKRWLGEHWLMALGNLSEVLGYIILIFATTSVVMFVASLFAGMYCINAFCHIVGTLAVNNIYAATLTWFDRTVFAIGSVLNTIGLSIVLIFIFLTQSKRRQTQSTVTNVASGDGEELPSRSLCG